MERRAIRFVEHFVEKKPRKQFGLLGLKFRSQEGEEFIWWPKWGDVRVIFALAIATEWANEDIYRFGETEKFIEFARMWAEAPICWAKQSLERDKQRLTQLIEAGNYRQAHVLLNTDLLKVADWLAQSSSESPPEHR